CVLCRSRPADCPILFPYTTLFRSDCLPLPLVVTRTACVPRTNCEESLTSADWVPAPPALQPCDFWNCSDQVARRCLGPRPEGAYGGGVLSPPMAPSAAGAAAGCAATFPSQAPPPAMATPPAPPMNSAARRLTTGRSVLAARPCPLDLLFPTQDPRTVSK